MKTEAPSEAMLESFRFNSRLGITTDFPSRDCKGAVRSLPSRDRKGTVYSNCEFALNAVISMAGGFYTRVELVTE